MCRTSTRALRCFVQCEAELVVMPVCAGAEDGDGDENFAGSSSRDRKPPVVDLMRREAFQQATLNQDVVCDVTDDRAGAVWTTAPKRRRRF